jgi:quinone-modifying oxidoreductase subunit QmoB
MERPGLFLCTGCDIGKAIKIDDLEELANENNAALYTTHECLCSPEGLETINKALEDGTIDSVLVAACSPRAKTEEFRFDPTKVASERVSLREQVAWTQPHGGEDTQMLAEDLLRMGLVRISKMELAKPHEESIEQTVLVVGGGVTGLNAALAANGMGNPVVLIEKSDKLGGHLRGIKDIAPQHPPYDSLHNNSIDKIISQVEGNSDIKVHLSSQIKQITGQPGQFDVEITNSSGSENFRVGAIVQATGASPYDANKLEHLGYGKSPNVITSHELERMLAEGKLQRPSDQQAPNRVLFVQCAGSRDKDHLPYCSSECCLNTLKQTAVIQRDFSDTECMVVYRDLRSPGQYEHFYLAAQEKGCMFTRGTVEKIEGSDSLSVQIKESLLGEEVVLDADLVVLATGMVPNSADSEGIRTLIDAQARIEKNESETQVADATKVVEAHKHLEGTEILNLDYRQGPDLPFLEYDFPDSHYICFPYETRRTGIYSAGTVHAPMDAAQAVEDAWGAAMKAVQCIAANARGEAVHPRANDVSIADFFLQRCTQCKRCTEECPFGSINEDEKGTPQYNPLRCRRCGICLGACPERIISFPEYSVDAVASMIKAIEVPDEDEEKPRIVALMCENDALPALEEASAKGIKYNPWVRIIPVRCLGAVNTVWYGDALSRGIDGLILIGCKRGDDYQCHYIKGSELANTRLTNVQETLERLALEAERIKIIELAHNEFDRVPQLLDEFAEELDDMGPNPLKGF